MSETEIYDDKNAEGDKVDKGNPNDKNNEMDRIDKGNPDDKNNEGGKVATGYPDDKNDEEDKVTTGYPDDKDDKDETDNGEPDEHDDGEGDKAGMGNPENQNDSEKVDVEETDGQMDIIGTPETDSSIFDEKCDGAKTPTYRKGKDNAVSRVQLKDYDVKTLQPGKLINDAIIMWRMEKIIAGHDDVLLFDTFFSNRNQRTEAAGVTSYTRNVKDLSKYSKLMFPIHHQMRAIGHWFLIVVDLASKTVSNYDSLSGAEKRRESYMRGVVNYVKSTFKKNSSAELRFAECEKDIPKQGENSMDCGIFMCCYAEKVLKGNYPNLTPSAVLNMRKTWIEEAKVDAKAYGGKVNDPKSKSTGKVDDPKTEGTGKVDAPKAKGTGKVDDPKAEVTGKVDDPKAEGTGKVDDPKPQGAVVKEDDKKQCRIEVDTSSFNLPADLVDLIGDITTQSQEKLAVAKMLYKHSHEVYLVRYNSYQAIQKGLNTSEWNADELSSACELLGPAALRIVVYNARRYLMDKGLTKAVLKKERQTFQSLCQTLEFQRELALSFCHVCVSDDDLLKQLFDWIVLGHVEPDAPTKCFPSRRKIIKKIDLCNWMEERNEEYLKTGRVTGPVQFNQPALFAGLRKFMQQVHITSLQSTSDRLKVMELYPIIQIAEDQDLDTAEDVSVSAAFSEMLADPGVQIDGQAGDYATQYIGLKLNRKESSQTLVGHAVWEIPLDNASSWISVEAYIDRLEAGEQEHFRALYPTASGREPDTFVTRRGTFSQMAKRFKLESAELVHRPGLYICKFCEDNQLEQGNRSLFEFNWESYKKHVKAPMHKAYKKKTYKRGVNKFVCYCKKLYKNEEDALDCSLRNIFHVSYLPAGENTVFPFTSETENSKDGKIVHKY